MADADAPTVRVCDHCLAEVTQRLVNVAESDQSRSRMKELAKSSSSSSPSSSHEELVKKLQEEMERNASRRAAAMDVPKYDRVQSRGSGQMDRSSSNSSVQRLQMEQQQQQPELYSCQVCGTVAFLPQGSGATCPGCGTAATAGRSAGANQSMLQGPGGGGGGGFSPGPAQGGGINMLLTPPHLWPNAPVGAGPQPHQMAAASGGRMQEVACPTCTAHLQVQLPVYGTETVECGVCSHPFLISAV
eukprot:TRINITY_DN1271_c0_g2_i1.p1 TRINITY_DN1271_c0_g2~~TRINITY_DN1271_c0_g2_i1.p1  ORF type:complete len:262 (-),score=85.42 TRINITY_DN1271_c0_g2_i1:196-930(-)